MPDPIGWVVLVGGALVGSLIGGVAGFGTGIIMLPLVAWVLSVSRNLCIDRYRRRKRENSFRFVSDEAVTTMLKSEDDPAFVELERGGKTVHYTTFHGTRHTFSSHWVMGGGDLFRLQRILGVTEHDRCGWRMHVQ